MSEAPGALSNPLERGNSTGRATRELIIITAEALFSERGTAAVSLREIGQAAGQRNNGAIQYHFGTRENLIEAIDEFRAQQIDSRRWELLAELEADGRLDDARTLLHAMFTPHLESLFDPDSHFLGFLARRLVDGGSLVLKGSNMSAATMSAHRRFVELIAASLPDVDPTTFRRRFRLTVNWIIQALANFERSTNSRSRKRVDDMFNDVVSVLTAGLTAPVLPAEGDGSSL